MNNVHNMMSLCSGDDRMIWDRDGNLTMCPRKVADTLQCTLVPLWDVPPRDRRCG